MIVAFILRADLDRLHFSDDVLRLIADDFLVSLSESGMTVSRMRAFHELIDIHKRSGVWTEVA